MYKRTAHRWRLTLTIVLGVLVACGTFWLVEVVNRGNQDLIAEQNKSEPDYVVERFSFVRLDVNGKPSYIVGGDKLTHLPIDDSSDIDKPVVHSLSPDQPPLNIKADKAHVDQGNTRVQLNGNVDLTRAASPLRQSLHMTTQALTVFPDEDRITTPLAVEMHVGDMTATGVGMQANNATSQLHLGGRGGLTIPPRVPGAPPK